MKRENYITPDIALVKVMTEMGFAGSDPYLEVTPGGKIDENEYGYEL